MKRFHLHVSVKNLDESIRFYSTLFAAEPVVRQANYAKWMLEDPRLNFAISPHPESLSGSPPAREDPQPWGLSVRPTICIIRPR